MIHCLRFKRARLLVHCYVVPGLCASAIALAGCALPATTAPPSPGTDSATKEPMATVSMEPPIQVGDVAAVYVTVTNLRPVDVTVTDRPVDMTGHQVNEVIVLQAHAVAQSGGQVDRLDVDHAIEKAGTADKLLAALGESGSGVAKPEPSGGGSWGPSIAFIGGFLALAPLSIPALATYLAVAYARGEFTDKKKIEDKEFQVAQYIANQSPWEKDFIQPQVSWKSYLFFPRGNYSALDITVGAIDDSSVPPETRCGGWLGICWIAPVAVAHQIDRGESPTLRHTETIRCPWRQESVYRTASEGASQGERS